MSEPFKLFRLQQIDSQIDRSRLRLQEIEIALTQDESLRLATQQAEQAARELEACRKALRKAEQESQDQRVKIEQTESTLYSGKIKNPKELQDMQKEAAALKRYRSVLEDRQLEAMLAVEEAEAVQAEAQAHLEAVRGELGQQHKSLMDEQANLARDLTRLESERQAIAGSIPDADQALYNQLRKQRRGVAVAKVTNKACSACGSVLNAALLAAAHSPTQLTRCDTCGRILYQG